jgi:pimeloyl-ACP methyl ester carboxylesterase
MIADREYWVNTGPHGLQLRVCEWGPTQGRSTVVLHGFLEQSAAWNAVARGLSGRVVAPDHRGHGRSAHVGTGGFYHFWDYVSDLDGLVATLDGPVDLVGHSMGGTVAALFAGARPELVRRLVLIEGLGPPDLTGGEVKRARTYLDHMRRGRTHSEVRDLEDATRRVGAPNNLPPEVAGPLAARLIDGATTTPTWTWDALHRARSPSAFSAAVFARFLQAITAPTLLVYGARSPYLMIPDLSEREAHVARAGRVVIEHSGHHPHHDQPAELSALINSHFEA